MTTEANRTADSNQICFLREPLALCVAFRNASTPPIDAHPSTPLLPSPLYEVHLYNPKSAASNGLGDFTRIWKFAGLPTDEPSIRPDQVSESYSSAVDKTTPPSSLPEDDHTQDALPGKVKEVRWTDEIAGNSIADIRQFRNRSSRSSSSIRSSKLNAATDDSDFDLGPSASTRGQRKSRNKSLAGFENTSDLESDGEYDGEHQATKRLRRSVSESGGILSAATQEAFQGLIPTWVTPEQRPQPTGTSTLWLPKPLAKMHRDRSIIQPLKTLTRREKYISLLNKLRVVFAHEPGVLQMKADIVAKQFGGNAAPDGLHIFVDCSNIVIGFVDELKKKRGIRRDFYVKGGHISWHALALVLERGRPVARRVLVGSHGSPLHETQMKRPEYMAEADICGYELNVLERVLKSRDPTPVKNRGGTGNGYATASGYSSGSDGQKLVRAVAEQAVDEVLHMKLLESLVDRDEAPSTIVLASGDGAEAEYSGGFKKNVERALKKGWKVEVVAWRSGLSRDYTSKAFLEKWKGQLSFIFLDSFCEEMLALYPTSIKAPKEV